MKALPKTLCSALLLGISFLGLSACDYVSNQQKTETKIAGKTMGTFYNITVVGEYPGGPEPEPQRHPSHRRSLQPHRRPPDPLGQPGPQRLRGQAQRRGS